MFNKRIQWLDFDKGFAMFFVVLAHCVSNPHFMENPQYFVNAPLLKYLYYFSFLFIMPIFFTISGFLYKRINSLKDYLLLIYKKGISLLTPYFIFSIIYYFCNIITGHKLSLTNLFLGYKMDIVLWFLVSLFLMFIIVGAFDLLHINRIIIYILSITVLILSKNFWMYSNNINVNHSNIYLIYSYLIFFCIGMIIRKYRHIFINIFDSYVFQISILLIFVISFVIQIDMITTFKYQNNFISISNIIPKILSVFLVFSVSSNLKHGSYLFSYFTKYGKYTLIIYLMHFAFEINVINVLHLNANIYSCLGLFICTWMFSVLICKLAIKLKIINFIFYPRKYINKIIVKSTFGRKLLQK